MLLRIRLGLGRKENFPLHFLVLHLSRVSRSWIGKDWLWDDAHRWGEQESTVIRYGSLKISLITAVHRNFAPIQWLFDHCESAHPKNRVHRSINTPDNRIVGCVSIMCVHTAAIIKDQMEKISAPHGLLPTIRIRDERRKEGKERKKIN
jgi:hypothetical protein